MSFVISSPPGRATVVYIGPSADDVADRWNDHDRSLKLVGLETVDALPIEQSAKAAVIETTSESDTSTLIDAVRETVGTGPVVVVHRGPIREASSIAPEGASSYLTVARDCDTIDVLERLAEHIREAIGTRRDQAMLETVLSTFQMAVYFKDHKSRHLAVSDATIDHIGPPYIESPDGKRHTHPDDILGKTDFDLYSADIAGPAIEDDQTVLETEEQIDDRIEASYNEEGWRTLVSTTKAPWYDIDDDLGGVVGITRNISQRKQYEIHLERQNKRLRRLATMVSHDLRNPLSVATGRLELARESGSREHFDAVEQSLHRIEELIDNVLFVTRQGITVTAPQEISLQSLARSVWETLDYEQSELRTPTAETIYAEPGRLRLLFEQLFTNAVEHGATGEAPISITVGDLEDGGFFVADDGSGIPQEEREAIFEPGLTAADRLGLGLHLVASIADAHAWSVRITESEEGGARFEFHSVRHVDGVK